MKSYGVDVTDKLETIAEADYREDGFHFKVVTLIKGENK